MPAQLQDLVDMLGPASVAEILALIEPGWTDDLARLRAGVAAGSEHAVRDAAHKLRGSASMCGFAEVTAAAEAIERAASNGSALGAERAALERCIADAVPRVRAWRARLG